MRKEYAFLLMMSGLICAIFLFTACGWSTNDQLYLESSHGNTAKVKGLLDKGADVNHRFLLRNREFEPYETALIAAAENGHLDIVKMLVEAGADLEIQNTYTSETALYKAVKNKHRQVIDYLLEQGADPNVEDSPDGTTIMILAILQNDLGLIKHLAKYGAWPDPDQRTAKSIQGSVALNAVDIARALRRPYTGYLAGLVDHCRRVFKTKTTCATIIVKSRKKEKNKALDF